MAGHQTICPPKLPAQNRATALQLRQWMCVRTRLTPSMATKKAIGSKCEIHHCCHYGRDLVCSLLLVCCFLLSWLYFFEVENCPPKWIHLVCLFVCLLGSHLFLGPFTPLSLASSGASGHSGDSMAPGASKEDLGWNNRLCQPKKNTCQMYLG